jgi:ArsR family transcriptional regulator
MATTTQTTENLPRLARSLKTLGDANRLRIVNLLMQGEYCNCELGDELGLAPNLISHHLGVLRRAGLIEARRDSDDARWVYYSLNQAALRELHGALGATFDPTRVQQRTPRCGVDTIR